MGEPAARADLEDIGKLLREMREHLGGPESHLLAAAPSVSRWSAAQHAHHVLLASYFSLRNSAQLLQGDGDLARDPVDRREEGLALLRAGAIERGSRQAPRFLLPPDDLPLEEVRAVQGKACRQHEELQILASERTETGRTILHHELGDLTAAEWMRFARVHLSHHLEILRDVLAALDARPAAPSEAEPPSDLA